MGGILSRALALAAMLALGACSSQPEAGNVSEERLLAAEGNGDDWLSHGRTYAEQRFSPLTDIDDTNVGQLSLAWAVELDTNRGQEATPIVVDGVMYLTTAWSKVMAVDAASGKVLWQFDPQAIGPKGAQACCDVVNRGVAVWEGKVYSGTIDGRLIALDARTGGKLWDVVTVDQSKPYTITGAPRVVRGKVIIGNSGAELGVRGYVSAYDGKPATWSGGSTPCPATQPMAPTMLPPTKRSRSSPARPGTASGGRWAAAAPCGTRSSTTPSSTSC